MLGQSFPICHSKAIHFLRRCCPWRALRGVRWCSCARRKRPFWPMCSDQRPVPSQWLSPYRAFLLSLHHHSRDPKVSPHLRNIAASTNFSGLHEQASIAAPQLASSSATPSQLFQRVCFLPVLSEYSKQRPQSFPRVRSS
jgi:hypothetical protein